MTYECRMLCNSLDAKPKKIGPTDCVIKRKRSPTRKYLTQRDTIGVLKRHHRMSTQTSVSPERVVIGCLFAPTDPNGFVDVTIRDGPKGTFTLTRHNRFFSELSNMKQYHSSARKNEDNESYFIHMIYDKTLHGTPRCPYLVVKGMCKGQAVDLERKDYMAATNAVDQYVNYVHPITCINNENVIV